ncbi:MAG: HD domain-containing protein [Acidobacteria bacterium]|nr:HD domain-containing protein [Acidobacteriota bacterium]
MKSPTVSELAPGQMVEGVFLVQSREVRQKRTGDPYLSLVLMDRTGEVDGKMWDNVATVMGTFDRDDFVRVKGETQLHQNRLQITIHSLQYCPETGIDLADFLPASKRDPDEMLAELRGTIASMGNEHLRGLLEALFADEETARRYKTAPAAKGIHHAWLGGLIEHVLSMCAMGRFLARHYTNIDEDLLLAGVVLHDLGKIHELSYARSFGYSTEGGLLGHIQIALRMIGEKLPPGFPPKLRQLLEHMILSHHGQLEFGSPKTPVFPEALLLHHLDNLDSKMETMRASIEKDKPLPSEWTGYNAALERSVLDKDKYLAEKAAPERKAGKAAPAARPAGGSSMFGQALKSAVGEAEK